MKPFKIKNVNEMHKWARGFARTLTAPCVVALHGDLGMGKTEIARTIIQTLCGPDIVVPSPTFTLVQTYETCRGAETAPLQKGVCDTPLHISHFDLFRITAQSELEEIGLLHACANDITLIEWPEIADGMLPPGTIHLYLTGSGEEREISIQ